MYAKGHTGLTLLIASLLVLPFGYDAELVLFILLSAGLSALPDIDLEWQRKGIPIHHRGVTHSILFALLIGLGLGSILFYSQKTLEYFLLGFFSGFIGIISHLIGDSFTKMAFKPLWPFSNKEVCFGFCTAGNKAANEGLMTVGMVAFILYILITNGALNNIL
jgi:inner membrane protein